MQLLGQMMTEYQSLGSRRHVTIPNLVNGAGFDSVLDSGARLDSPILGHMLEKLGSHCMWKAVHGSLDHTCLDAASGDILGLFTAQRDAMEAVMTTTSLLRPPETVRSPPNATSFDQRIYLDSFHNRPTVWFLQ